MEKNMLKVVVVDDTMMVRRTLKYLLEKELGHEVLAEGTNGIEGVEAFKNNNPDLVTMDITMPEMDGITAVQKIMEINPEAKIIMVTSYGQEDMVLKAVQAGASSYLVKPITADKLQDAISKVFPEYESSGKNDGDNLDAFDDYGIEL
jgi:two-component system chemotaxis response regulator CheY